MDEISLNFFHLFAKVEHTNMRTSNVTTYVSSSTTLSYQQLIYVKSEISGTKVLLDFSPVVAFPSLLHTETSVASQPLQGTAGVL